MGDWPYRGPEERRKQLDAALNDILCWVADELANGWQIELTITGGDDGGKGEAFGDGEVNIVLLDLDGKVVSADWDGDRLNVWDMVDHSRNPDGETQ